MSHPPGFIHELTAESGPLPLDQWFDPARPLEVDVGCGKGRFLVTQAREHPDHNFIGIDRQLGRLRKVERKLHQAGVSNVRLLRTEAAFTITFQLPADSVDVFYIFFPDPWPKRRHQGRRLFNPAFLDAVHRALRTGGRLHLATDHQPYFDEVAALLGADRRFVAIPTFEPPPEQRTEFETIFLQQSRPVRRGSFQRV